MLILLSSDITTIQQCHCCIATCKMLVQMQGCMVHDVVRLVLQLSCGQLPSVLNPQALGLASYAKGNI